MALTDKNIIITPNVGNTSDPKIAFVGANSSVGAQTVNMYVYPASNGTLSFEGSAGQLFSITNDLSSTLFNINDISGIPSVSVEANGMVSLAPYSGSVVIGPTGESTLTVNSNTTAWIPVFGTSEVAPTSLTSFVIHRHSTAYEPVITGARSNSNTTTHTAVSAGQSLLTMQGAGSAGANGYQLFGSISIGASNTGTIGATSAPGKITFNTTSNNAVSPTAALTLDWDKTATFAGNVLTGQQITVTGNSQVWATAPRVVFNTTTSNANNRNWFVGAVDTNYGNFHIFPGSAQGAVPDETSETTSGLMLTYAGNMGLGINQPVNTAWGTETATKQLTINGTDYGVLNLKGSMTTNTYYSAGVGGGRYYAAYDNIAAVHRMTFYGNYTGFNNVTSPSYNIHLAGTGFASTDWRAPIFYDSSDTSFYMNPNSFSDLGWIRVRADWSSSGVHPEAFTIKGSYPSMTFRATNGSCPVWLVHNDGGGGLNFYSVADSNPDSGNWGNRFWINNTGYVGAQASFRAPIFYDNDDTSCYTNPAGYSNLHYMGLRYWKADLDRTWDGYPSITVYNDGTYGPQGEFRVHGYPGASGGDYSITLRADAGFASGSDARRKINIDTIPNALDRVLSLRGTTFNIINRDGDIDPYQKGKKFGLIAQEAKDVIPEAILFDESVDTPNENGWASAYSIDYASLTALLIEAIKEQQQQIDALITSINGV